MIQPTGYPGWASGPSGWWAEPTATKKALGWQPNEAPPSAYQNWLHKLTYDWITYLDFGMKMPITVEDDFIATPIGGGPTGPVNSWLWCGAQQGVTRVNLAASEALIPIGSAGHVELRALGGAGEYQASLLPGVSVPVGTGAWQIAARVRVVQGASSNGFIPGMFAVGIGGGNGFFDNAANVSGYCYIAQMTGYTNWQLNHNIGLGSSPTHIDLGIAPTGAFQTLLMSKDNNANLVAVINGRVRATVSNLTTPQSGSLGIGIGLQHFVPGYGATLLWSIDYFKARLDRNDI